MNIFKIVQTFASLTQESVLNTLSLSRSFRQCYIENTEMLPVSINPLVDAHFNQRLRETAHSRSKRLRVYTLPFIVKVLTFAP